jgi:hypothetical protein
MLRGGAPAGTGVRVRTGHRAIGHSAGGWSPGTSTVFGGTNSPFAPFHRLLVCCLMARCQNGLKARAEQPQESSDEYLRNGSVQGPHNYTVYSGADQHRAHEWCVAGLRTRTIIAVVLALIV